jgi:hypothetical protein
MRGKIDQATRPVAILHSQLLSLLPQPDTRHIIVGELDTGTFEGRFDRR